MSLDALVILVGAIIALLPFLGFPIAWQGWMFLVLGIIVIGLGIAVRRRGERIRLRALRGEFVESIPQEDS